MLSNGDTWRRITLRREARPGNFGLAGTVWKYSTPCGFSLQYQGCRLDLQACYNVLLQSYINID